MAQKKNYKIMAINDKQDIINSLSQFFENSNYLFSGFNNPHEAIETLKNEHFDILILGFIMFPLNGDKIVEEIRKFNKDIYIILLTSHKNIAPPLETLKKLDIQAYCEKSDNFEQLILLVESALKSIKQMNTIKNINENLEKTNKRLEQAYLESIQTLRYTVEAKDTYTRGHSDRVSEYSILIGEKMGLSENDIQTLMVGGIFHDIGKIGISDSILLKETKLTDSEYNEIKKHPSIGKNILSNTKIFQNLIPIVYYHHERFDGTGYPEGLSGDEIPLLARIVSVADAFDAMTSKRSYRNDLSIPEAIEELKRCSGSQFDPNITKVFLDILNYEPYKILEIKRRNI